MSRHARLKHRAFIDGQLLKIELSNESAGTQAFIILALHFLLTQKNQGKVILVDEFNSSFHIELSEALLNLINRTKQNNQFILTTHELFLMDYELRKDQIYFAEKDREGSTDLFSLFDFAESERKLKNVTYERDYLNGRYGGMPLVSSALLKAVVEEDDG